MLNSSQDILFYTLAICAIMLTAFTCWILYYIIAVIRNAYDMTKSIKKKIDALDDILKTIKINLNNAANYVGLVVTGIDKIVNYVQNKKSTEPKKDSKKK